MQATGVSRRPTTQASSPSPSDSAAEVARLLWESGQLRMEREPQVGASQPHPKKSRAHLRSGLPVKFGFVDEHRQVWPVRVMCAVLGLSASGYYAWRGRPESQRSVANRALTEDIRLIHARAAAATARRASTPPCAGMDVGSVVPAWSG